MTKDLKKDENFLLTLFGSFFESSSNLPSTLNSQEATDLKIFPNKICDFISWLLIWTKKVVIYFVT